eukprot:jgi/Picre1/28154/NNA_003560.t1
MATSVTKKSDIDRTVAFLKKRDGIDKVLKVTRYTCKLLFCRLALIGKFLEHVSALQKKNPYLVPSISSSILELLVNVGEGVYYFIDQFQFFVKIGVLSVRQGETLTKREIALISELKRRKNKSEAGGSFFDPSEDTNKVLLSEIHSLRRRRTLRTLCLAQDAADAFLAIHDLRDVYGRPTGGGMRKSVLAAAGVVSGCIGMYKKF